MKLRDVMTPNPRTLDSTATVQDAARVMRDADTGVVPIVENGKPVGLITDRDIVVRAVADGAEPTRPVRELATDTLVTAEPDMSTGEAAELMGQHQVRRLLVCEGDRLVGVASIGDIAVKEGKDRRIGDTLQEISQGVKGQRS
ncbi:MAG TPA: CBS domain-containing protein [Vicinamibacterales bacterium]|jgi:CBS domain-containing protein|nr:CBS domain-containing protein [Vicinamibacterales bacterium]